MERPNLMEGWNYDGRHKGNCVNRFKAYNDTLVAR
jgi:hypothetical protein